MNKDEIQARIIKIDAEMTQLKANYAKLEGHLAESQHWMSLIVQAEMGLEAPKVEEACDGQVNDQSPEQAPQE